MFYLFRFYGTFTPPTAFLFVFSFVSIVYVCALWRIPKLKAAGSNPVTRSI